MLKHLIISILALLLVSCVNKDSTIVEGKIEEYEYDERDRIVEEFDLAGKWKCFDNKKQIGEILFHDDGRYDRFHQSGTEEHGFYIFQVDNMRCELNDTINNVKESLNFQYIDNNNLNLTDPNAAQFTIMGRFVRERR